MKFIIDELFKNNQIDTVVEPFCGSCAVSFYIFNNHDPEKKIKYLINDNDKLLIDFLQHIKINGSDKLFNEINEILKLPYEDYKLKFNDIKSEYKTKPNIFNYLFYNKIYTYRRGLLIPEDKYKNIFINYERSKKINDNLDLFFKKFLRRFFCPIRVKEKTPMMILNKNTKNSPAITGVFSRFEFILSNRNNRRQRFEICKFLF